MTKPRSAASDLRSLPPTWCPGCGDFGIWVALRRALESLQLGPDQLIIVFDIGCSGNMVNFVRAYGFHGLHGRTMPVAEGIRLANHRLPVIVIGGDGGGLGEGVGHFVHTVRSNPNITYLLHDNQVYGLTKGQHSPTAPHGFVSPTAPDGVLEEPINPISLTLALGASFVARGFAGDPEGLQRLIVQAVQHEGFSFVDILQPCVTYNHNSYAWFRQRVYLLDEANHDRTNFDAAWKRAREDLGTTIGLGVFYQHDRPTLESQIAVLKEATLIEQQPKRPRDVSDLLSRYR